MCSSSWACPTHGTGRCRQCHSAAQSRNPLPRQLRATTWEGAGMAPGPALRCLRPGYIPRISPLLRLFPFLIVVLFLSFLLNHLPGCSNIVCCHPHQTNSHRTLPTRQIRAPVDAQPHDPRRNPIFNYPTIISLRQRHDAESATYEL